MEILKNTYRGSGKLAANAPYPSVAVERVAALLGQCPAASETPLVQADGLSGDGKLWVKDERTRMGLGSFKALGAAYVVARAAADKENPPTNTTLAGITYVTASAGNHGLSVAAGARVFRAKAVIYLAETVPASFADRLRDIGAEVCIHGHDYASSMEAAQKAAAGNDWVLLSDTSWDGYTDIPYTLMEGYLQMAAEAVDQMEDVPSHIFLQAGVGGLACAVAAYARHKWGDAPTIIVVEPDNAPALIRSIEQGKSIYTDGPESVMGRLDCKEPSLIALNGLARDADYFVTVSDDYVLGILPELEAVGLETSASGGAGVAAAMHEEIAAAVGINADSKILTFLSEGPA